MKLKIAHIAVEKAVLRLTEIYDHAPHEVVIQSFLTALKDQSTQISELRNTIASEDSAQILKKVLEAWDEEYSGYQQRLEEYFAAFEGAETPEDIQKYVLDPIFDGEYPKDMDIVPAGWGPDLQTGFRLSNDLAQMASIARPKSTETQEELAATFKTQLRGMFEAIDSSLTEPIMTASTTEDQSTLDWAKQKAQEALTTIDDYVQLKKIQEGARKAAPLLVGALGAAAIILLARRR